ncbi:MAG: hypothetical protein RL685_175 [Pseudomonadota bacterium]|jgi:hypothetical protein
MPMVGGAGHHFVVDGPYGAATIIVGPPGAPLLLSSAVARDGHYSELLSGRGVTVGVIGPDRQAVAALAAVLQPG